MLKEYKYYSVSVNIIDRRGRLFRVKVVINIIISYTDMPAGAPVLLLLCTKETVPYRPDKNLR